MREELIPEFFRNFWSRRNALDKKNYKQLIETTVEIASKVGGGEIIKKIVDELKDENESYRKIVIETIEKIIGHTCKKDFKSEREGDIRKSEADASMLNSILGVVAKHSLEDGLRSLLENSV